MTGDHSMGKLSAIKSRVGR